jgi:acetyl esterase/lipase
MKHTSLFTLVLSAAAMTASLPAAETVELPLWPDGAPGTHGAPNNETNKNGAVLNTFQPSIRVFLPPAKKATGSAMIVCPGGGYNVLVMDREGDAVARKLNGYGISAFVLKYRLRDHMRPDDASFHARALSDAQRAIRFVRANADRWHLRPDRIGIGGFSAGGHLSANAGTHFDAGQPGATDVVERVSCRPDFLVLVYPVAEPLASQVTRETPPAFLVHGSNDSLVPPRHSLEFYAALQTAGVPAELHIFDGEEHGFDIGKPGTAVGVWPDLLHAWLVRRGFEP